MSWSNYDEVVEQIRGAGLLVDSLEIDTDRAVRCKVDDSREKKGWYWLHEWVTNAGERLLVGAYGRWQGNDNTARKIDLKRRELSAEEKAAIAARYKEDKRRAEASRKASAARAAKRASDIWLKCATEGESPYLARKGVGAYGVRFTTEGTIVVPMTDAQGRIQGLQFIGPAVKKKTKTRDKTYWPGGLAKSGTYHMAGSPTDCILLAEGYATFATIREATDRATAMAFDANNLLPVAQALAKRYRVPILVCADDDYLQRCRECREYTLVEEGDCAHCGKPHGNDNPGINAARAAALAVSGGWVAPKFSDDRPTDHKGSTDFNDLHLAEGLHTVRVQIETALDQLLQGQQAPAGIAHTQGAGESGGRLVPIQTFEELLERFVLVYGHKQTVFDHQERILMSLSDMRDACTQRWIHQRWMETPSRKLVRIREVGFDPAGTDANITCNLWGGWPTQPKAGNCETTLELLEYLCGTEKNSHDVYGWVLKWLAYPIQHPGAKMKTALVFHGPQGVGKNLFFEAIVAIYGEYGRVVDQDAIEDKYNDWVSKKLFLVADEVVARQELYHTKNKLKGLITGDTIRINPKHVTAHEESNHVNVVFLSNETQPLVLERDDRRYTVIWCPKELSAGFYKEVGAELKNGGIAALHDHLLNLDLGDFTPYTRPPATMAKADLIELSMDSTERFWRDWVEGKLDGVPIVPTKSANLFGLYRDWCGRKGFPRYAPEPRFLAEIGKRGDAKKQVARYMNGSGLRQGTFIFPPGAAQPADKTQPLWLSECLDEFNTGVEEWKDA